MVIQKLRNLVESGEVKLYCTNEAPNGTSTLIVTNEDHETVGYLDEAFFATSLMVPQTALGTLFNLYGESVVFMPHDDENFEDAYNDLQEDEVFEISLDMALRCLAESPIRTRFKALRLFVETIKERA